MVLLVNNQLYELFIFELNFILGEVY